MSERLGAADIDSRLAIVGLLLSILLSITIIFTIGRAVYVMTGILAGIACAIWLIIRRRVETAKAAGGLGPTTPLLNELLIILFLLFFVISILVLEFRPNPNARPLTYFVCTSIMAGLAAMQIAVGPHSRRHVIISLFEIVAIGTSLEFSQVLMFPSVIGLDPWVHQEMTQGILAQGTIPKGYYGYSEMPVFHLDVALASAATGLDYRLSTMFSVSMIQVALNTLSVFLLGRLLLNGRIGLLGGLLLSVSNYELHLGFWTIPTTLAVVLIPLSLFVLLRGISGDTNRFRIVALILMATIILTHALAAMAMAIFLVIGWIVYKRGFGPSSERMPFNLPILGVQSVGMFAFWAFVSSSLEWFTPILMGGFNNYLFVNAPTIVMNYAARVPLSEQLYNNLGVFLSFSLSLVGCFYLLSTRFGSRRGLFIAVVGFVSLVLPFVSTIQQANILNDRWWYIAQVFLSAPLAISICLISSQLRRKWARPLIVFSVVTILSFLMATSTIANIDNRIFAPNTGVRVALTDGEIQAAKECRMLSNSTVGTDPFYAMASHYIAGSQSISIEGELLNASFQESSHNLVLIREEIVHEPFFLHSSLPWKLEYDPKSVLDNEGFSRVFDNGSVTGFLGGG